MAIRDENYKNWSLVDRDEDTKIGLKVPINLDGGPGAFTDTTLDAVKQNIINLCNTEQGERVMQPGLGIVLRRYLFQPFSEDLVIQIQETISNSLSYWLPFAKINNIMVKMSDNTSGDFRSAMEIQINFSLKRDPNTHESVQITVGEL